jgi:hypothetical protein
MLAPECGQSETDTRATAASPPPRVPRRGCSHAATRAALHSTSRATTRAMRNGASVYLNLHVGLHIMSLFRRRSNLI